MRNKYLFTAVLLVVLLFAGMVLTDSYVSQKQPENQEENLTEVRPVEIYSMHVVTSFYPMYIAAMNIIGDTPYVTLENLSEPQTGCLHDYQLTPEDMKLLSASDVFIVNGGGIEAFLSDVAEEYEDLAIINASEQADLIEDNAHAWMNIDTYIEQVQAITDGLCLADAAHAQQYMANETLYIDKLNKLKQEADELKPKLEGEQIVIFHEAYEYIADEYGLQVSYAMDLDEERQVSAGEVADVMRQIEVNQIHVVLAEELYGKAVGDTVKQESDAEVYYLNTLVRGDYSADSYLDGMEDNIRILKEAFAQ